MFTHTAQIEAAVPGVHVEPRPIYDEVVMTQGATVSWWSTSPRRRRRTACRSPCSSSVTRLKLEQGVLCASLGALTGKMVVVAQLERVDFLQDKRVLSVKHSTLLERDSDARHGAWRPGELRRQARER